jgi:hypothetical protein
MLSSNWTPSIAPNDNDERSTWSQSIFGRIDSMKPQTCKQSFRIL